VLGDRTGAAQCVQRVGDAAVQLRQVVSHVAVPSWVEPLP
jgi:hypothetical protein